MRHSQVIVALLTLVTIALACSCGKRDDPVIITGPVVHDTINVAVPHTTCHHHHGKGR